MAPLSDAEKVSRNLDTALDHLRAYKTRQDAIVLGLGAVRRELVAGYGPAALDELDEVLATTLKQSKDRVDNVLLALKLAVDALERHTAHKDLVDILSQIELVVPKEFKGFRESARSAAGGRL